MDIFNLCKVFLGIITKSCNDNSFEKKQMTIKAAWAKYIIYKFGRFCILVCLTALQPLSASDSKSFIDSVPFVTDDISMRYQIMTDKQGMLWLSTYSESLFRYNGAAGSTSINYQVLNDGKIDDWGRTWINDLINPDLFLGYFDTKNGQKVPVHLFDPNGQPIKYENTVGIQYQNSSIWLLTKSGELLYAPLSANLSQITFEHKTQLAIHPIAFFGRINLFTPTALTLDAMGNLWIALGDQLLRYQVASNKFDDFSLLIPPGQTIDFGVNVAITKGHKIWLTIMTLKKLYEIGNDNKVTINDVKYPLYDIKADPSRGRIWMTSTNGLHYINGEETKIHNYEPEPWQDSGVLTPAIRSLHVDQFNNLWIVSNKGIHVMRAIQNHIRRITPEVLRSGQELDAGLQAITSLTRQDANTLWWLNRRQELIRYSTETGQEQVFPIKFEQNHISDDARSVGYSAPYVLIITHSGSLLYFDTRSKRFVDSQKLPFGNSGNTNRFFDQVPDVDGQIWLTGIYNPIDPKTQAFLPERQFNYWDSQARKVVAATCAYSSSLDPTNDYANGDNIKSIFKYGDSHWLALNSYSSNIIIKLSLKDHSCPNIKLPFKSDRIYNLTQNDPESLWIVQGKWLRQIRLSDQAVLYDQPLPLETIESAHSDHQGHILVYGNASLWRFDIADKSWHLLFISEVTVDNNSGFKPFYDKASHQFYILSNQGIFAIDTTRNLELGKPKVQFTVADTHGSRTALYFENSNVVTQYGEILQIGYLSIPNYPSRLVNYRYRLSRDQPWTTTHSSVLMFSQLLPGLTRLEVQATYNNADYGDSTILDLHVIPPWWLSNWAYAFYVSLVVGFIYALVYWQRSKARLQEAKLTENVFENTTDGLCLLSSDFIVLNINQAMKTMMAWQKGDNLKPVFQQLMLAESNKSVLEIFQFNEQENHFLLEVATTDVFGEQSISELKVNAHFPEKHQKQYILVLENISERKAHEYHLFYLSRHDHLTGLGNRLAVEDYLEQVVNAPDAGYFAVICIGLDDFKKINDSAGHKVGDQILREVAVKLVEWHKALCQDQGLVARLGGDEFLSIMPLSEQNYDFLKADFQNVVNLFGKLENDVSLTCSLGVTLWPNQSSDISGLLQQADMALVHAKSLDKAQVVYYSNQFDQRLKRQIELEKVLLYNRGHFGLILFYQPKVDIASNRIYGIEALARWQFSEGNLVFPDQFLPLIHPGSMEKNFGCAVLRRACQDLLALHRIQPGLKLAVNVSPRLMVDSLFTESCQQIIAEADIDPKCLILEILEDAGIGELGIFENLKSFKDMGVAISIDDFGVGYSSLSHLTQLGANEIKSDKSFMTGIPGDKQAELMFQTIIAFGHNFNMSVVCEGIETKDQLDFIRHCGCKNYQGYYFSKPVPLSTLENLLIETNGMHYVETEMTSI